MIRLLLILLALALYPSHASTQTITATNVQFYRSTDSTAGTPFLEVVLDPALIVCNLPPTPNPPLLPLLVNPNYLEWSQGPTAPALVCRGTITQIRSTLPNGDYRSTISWTYLNPGSTVPLQTARSNVAGPFTVGLPTAPPLPLPVLAAPTGLGIRQ